MTIELNETGLAELDFATPEVDVHAELIERHRELAKIMVSPGKALAIPVAEPLEQKLLREYKEELVQAELRRLQARLQTEFFYSRSIIFPSSYCSPRRYDMMSRPTPQVPAFFSDDKPSILLPTVLALAITATIVAIVFVAGALLA